MENSHITIPSLGLTFSSSAADITPEQPPKLLCWAPTLRLHVGSTDTVEISASHNAASFRGRIVRVENHPDAISSADARHPFTLHRVHHHNDCYLKINLYLTKRDIDDVDWPLLTDRSIPANVVRAAPTNLLIWVHSYQVDHLVFFPHCEEVTNQTFGDISGRRHYYSIDHRAHVVSTNGTFQVTFFDLPSQEYNIFGFTPSPSPFDDPCTVCERIIEAQYQCGKELSSMVINNSTIQSTKHKRFPLSSEFFKYLWRSVKAHSLGNIISTGLKKSKFKQCLVKPYLVLSSTLLLTIQCWILARNVDAFQLLRQYFPNCGVGLKKKHPRISDINSQTGANHLTIQLHDTINIVDIGPYGAIDSSDDDSPNPNFIRLLYDTRLRRCHISLRCFSAVVSSFSDDVRYYLDQNNMVHEVETYVEYDDEIWIVEFTDIENYTTHLRHM
eukprot:scaffold15122_cov41-Cyclotella_meneghiniana.AAC.2